MTVTELACPVCGAYLPDGPDRDCGCSYEWDNGQGEPT